MLAPLHSRACGINMVDEGCLIVCSIDPNRYVRLLAFLEGILDTDIGWLWQWRKKSQAFCTTWAMY
jgi:hypothetical protein